MLAGDTGDPGGEFVGSAGAEFGVCGDPGGGPLGGGPLGGEPSGGEPSGGGPPGARSSGGKPVGGGPNVGVGGGRLPSIDKATSKGFNDGLKPGNVPFGIGGGGGHAGSRINE